MNEHQRAADLLHLQVNGRLAGEDSAWLGTHLEDCEHCRSEQRLQRRLRDALSSQPAVELAPQGSFNRLWQRIESDAGIADGSAAATTATLHSSAPPVAGRGVPYWMRGLLAAQAAAIVLLSFVLWSGRSSTAPPLYRTVTDPPAATAGPGSIKAIFADDVRLADVKDILAGNALQVASGPNAAGVYTLRIAGGGTVAQARLALLRLQTDPRVRFAELATAGGSGTP